MLVDFDLHKEPRKRQKEGQEDHRRIDELWGIPLAVMGLPGPSGLPSGSSLGIFGGIVPGFWGR